MNATCTMSQFTCWLHVPAMLAWFPHGDALLPAVVELPAGLAAVIELARLLACLG